MWKAQLTVSSDILSAVCSTAKLFEITTKQQIPTSALQHRAAK
jgi:hypothetical protein